MGNSVICFPSWSSQPVANYEKKRVRRGSASLDRRLCRSHICLSSFPGPIPLSSALGSMFSVGPHVALFVQHRTHWYICCAAHRAAAFVIGQARNLPSAIPTRLDSAWRIAEVKFIVDRTWLPPDHCIVRSLGTQQLAVALVS